MKLSEWKKLLVIIDRIEIECLDENAMLVQIVQELKKEGTQENQERIKAMLAYLRAQGWLKDTRHGLDLIPCAGILARAGAQSELEAMALFACFYMEAPNVWQCLFHDGLKMQEMRSLLGSMCFDLCMQSILFSNHQTCYRMQEALRDDLFAIQQECESGYLVPPTLCACFASDLFAQTMMDAEYKNEHCEMIAYPYHQQIIARMPKRGIPCDRKSSKALQAFYKDTLFHEFNHTCALCEIDFPPLLIGSHIKPFRDCAHLYEAIDHHNGLLLCRNHDILFDQGYFSFDEKGNLCIAQVLHKQAANSVYHLPLHHRLDATLLQKERQLFLQYHYEHIFLDAK